MLIKLRTMHADGWRWIDGIVDAETFGPIVIVDHESSMGPGAVPGEYLAVVSTMAEAQEAVRRVWGPPETREFDREVWPGFSADGGEQTNISTVVARFRDGSEWLLVLTDEAFLLSETGATVDRLR